MTKRSKRLAAGAIVVAAIAGGLHVSGWTGPMVSALTARVQSARAHEAPPRQPAAVEERAPYQAVANGLVLDAELQKAIGLQVVEVPSQSPPTSLELLGTTAYDPDSQTKVRTRFDALVVSVHVRLGQAVRKGDALIELESADLAQARTDYQTKMAQWRHDQRLLESRRALADSGAIAQQVWVDTVNAELQSGLAVQVARDKLQVFGISDDEIRLLGEPDSSGLDKARTTLVSPADGIVIGRDAVPGNLYDPADVLLVISPLDHLWVWGNVYESEVHLVRVGQEWIVDFPYLNETVEARVDYVSDQVDPKTRAVRIRGTIPNKGGRFKADMLVRSRLQIPPQAGQVVIPRQALLAVDGRTEVFVERPEAPNAFERRPVRVAQEQSDRVLVSEGLRPGELVVTAGSLLLEQYDEERRQIEGDAQTATMSTRNSLAVSGEPDSL